MSKNKFLKFFNIEILSFFVLLVSFLPLSLSRLIARDEGFYTMAARLVAEGGRPYIDFFFPQMPLTAYLYGAWFYVFGSSWISARILTAILAIILGLLLVNYLKKQWGYRFAFLGLVLFVTSSYVIAWYTVAQTYTLSVLLLFACFYFLTLERTTFRLLIASILFGLTIQSRLFFAGLFPILLIYIFISKKESFFKEACIFSVACTFSLLPLLPYLLHHFDKFYFNNLGYHLVRSVNDIEASFGNKRRVAGVALGYNIPVKFSAYQLPLLIFLSLLCFIKDLFRNKTISLAVLILFGLFVLNLIPTPTYVQYFSTLIPFGIVASIAFLAFLTSQKNKLRYIGFTLTLLFTLTYLYRFNEDIVRYTETGKGVIGIGNKSNAKHWNLASVISIGQAVNLNSADKVLVFWPGYLLDSKTLPYPGTENHFGFLAADRLNDAVKETKYKIMSNKTANRLIQERKVQHVLIGKKKVARKKFDKMLKSAGYQLNVEVNNAKLYSLSKLS